MWWCWVCGQVRKALLQTFDVVICDSTGLVNLSSRVTKSALAEVCAAVVTPWSIPNFFSHWSICNFFLLGCFKFTGYDWCISWHCCLTLPPAAVEGRSSANFVSHEGQKWWRIWCSVHDSKWLLFQVWLPCQVNSPPSNARWKCVTYRSWV